MELATMVVQGIVSEFKQKLLGHNVRFELLEQS